MKRKTILSRPQQTVTLGQVDNVVLTKMVAFGRKPGVRPSQRSAELYCQWQVKYGFRSVVKIDNWARTGLRRCNAEALVKGCLSRKKVSRWIKFSDWVKFRESERKSMIQDER